MQSLPTKVHFIGIGGVGMFTIAGILLEKGVKISGSDLELTSKTAKLISLGAQIFAGHREDNLTEDCELVVYSSAIKMDNPEVVKAKKLGIKLILRGEFLAELAKNYAKVIAVSGSHGKTSTCALIVHLLKKQNIDVGYLIGGELINGESFSSGDGSVFVTEADESDGTHTFFEPSVGVITNLDDDHSWSLGGIENLYRNFVKFATNCQDVLFFREELPCDFLDKFNRVGFAFAEREKIAFPPNVNGYQKNNAFLALKSLEVLGYQFKPDDLADFVNVKRRMSLIREQNNFILIEDYAHHPKELKSSLEYLRLNYPQYKLKVIFQVHRAARLSLYFDKFIEILNHYADEVIISKIFDAWLSDSSIYTPNALAERLNNGVYIEDFIEISQVVKKNLNADEKTLVAVIGAGDIQQVVRMLANE